MARAAAAAAALALVALPTAADAGTVEGAWPALVDRVARSSHPSVLLSDEVLVHAGVALVTL